MIKGHGKEKGMRGREKGSIEGIHIDKATMPSVWK